MPFASVAKQKIYYETEGARGGPVILVHGSGSNHAIWKPQVRALSTIARPVAIDLPGHGQSDLPGRNSVDDYGNVLLGLLDALQFDRAVVVGHSLGGAIAQSIALAHPDRVAGIGLVGTGARLRVLPAILDGILSDFGKTVPFVVENAYAPNLSDEMRERAIAELRACSPQVTHGDYAACNAFDVMARLGEIRAPTLVICGKQDRMTPIKYSEHLVSKIRGAQLVSIDNAGHSVMIEQPEATARALFDFVKNLPV
ncbi:MAG: alpha/beta hydrolase [Chloroflexi bacterium]|nr:alpha/beta hydrolase [Chloroflexota bacterium]